MVKTEDNSIKRELQTIIGLLLNQSNIQEKGMGESHYLITFPKFFGKNSYFFLVPIPVIFTIFLMDTPLITN